ncbi:L,D-transpeptidase [Methylobacterium sp. P31]
MAGVHILIDKSAQRMIVTVDGQPQYAWRISTGLPGHHTPSGSYRVLHLERMYFSKKYDNAPMPNAIFFTSVGHAIHGTYHVRQLGHAASHGCVRLSPVNAATLYSLVQSEGQRNTRITVTGSDRPAGQTREYQARPSRARRQTGFAHPIPSRRQPRFAPLERGHDPGFDPRRYPFPDEDGSDGLPGDDFE